MSENGQDSGMDRNDANLVKNRSEILFVYDITNANPNGDPNENRPRIDEDTEINLVSDVRLKRTVRDYLATRLGENVILVKASDDEKGNRKTREQLIGEFFAAQNDRDLNAKKAQQMLNSTFIDLRLFGATMPTPKKKSGKKTKLKSDGADQGNANQSDSTTEGDDSEASGTPNVFKWIGPVQFRFGHSLHKVLPMTLKGTSVFPSGEEKGAGTFTEFHYVPYSLIAFTGIVNEENAKATGLTENDVGWLNDALWNGTKGLTTRSKYGQMPRLLIQVIYKNGLHFHIGDMDNLIGLLNPDGSSLDITDQKGRLLRRVSELMLDLTNLVKALKLNSGKIKEIRIRCDSNVTFAVKHEGAIDRVAGTDLLGEFKKVMPEIAIIELSDMP